MKKRILVLGINYFPELTGIGKYTGEMTHWFADHGFETTVVTAPPYYPDWKVEKPYSGMRFSREMVNQNLKVYRCPLYVPSNPSGFKRMLHELTFLLSAFLVMTRLLFDRKFDILITVSPPFHLTFLMLFYRFFRGGRIVQHIQDLQVDAAKELGMLPGWLFPILFRLEKFTLNHVDVVSTISKGMRRKISAKVSFPIVLFPNWVDTGNFYPLDNPRVLKEKWGFLPEDKVVLYSGSMGEKQGLDSLLRIAANLEEHRYIKIVLCGMGPFKARLMQLSDELNLRNVYFLPLQDNDVFNEFLNMADVHLILQKGDASDLVMPSKLTTILAVGGLAIVTANSGTTLEEVVNEYRMGKVIAPENELELGQAILKCCSADFSKEKNNARVYAENYLNVDKILNEFIRQFD